MRIFKIFVTLFAALAVGCAVNNDEVYMFTSFHEPADEGLRFLVSTDGVVWDSIPGVWLRPEIGNQRVMRDPSIARGADGTFHLVWTSSWKGDNGFGYASSKDLMNWSEERFIPVMDYEPDVVNVWAPELFYDAPRDRFLIVWASCLPDRFECGEEERLNNHRLFYTVTTDFETFAPTKLFYDPGFSSIDATIVCRGENDYVLVFKDNTRNERDIKVAFATSPEGEWSAASAAFTPMFTEGPSVVAVGDEYYIYYDAYREFRYGAHKTKDFINFVDASAEVSVPKGHKHGTIFKAPRSVVDQLTKVSHK